MLVWRGVGGRSARVPAVRARCTPLCPSSGRLLSSCRVRTATRGSRGRGTPGAGGSPRTRIVAFGGTLECLKFIIFDLFKHIKDRK